jgi:hypothetical protein
MKTIPGFFKSRYLYMVLVGLGIAYVLHLINPEHLPGFKMWHSYLMSVIITGILWEGNIVIDTIFDRGLSWESNPVLRATIQTIASILFCFLLIYPSLWLYNTYVCLLPLHSGRNMIVASLLVGSLVSLLLLATRTGGIFFQRWNLAQMEAERYKQEVLSARLEVLKSQVNPHFLFNNLSVLSSLIHKDADQAVTFTAEFARVYRHLLEIRNSELVSLDSELDFLKSYIYLLSIRFASGIEFSVTPHPQGNKVFLPPLTLQILTENCIQHNRISEKNPLKISILCKNKEVVVSNNRIPRQQDYTSSFMGQKNIRMRLKHFTDREMKVVTDGIHYSVEIPLIEVYEGFDS